MRITQQDLIRAFKGNGDPFEAFVHALVRAVGRSCGVDPIYIQWDYRTNVKDGGRDLVVEVPNPLTGKEFLPARPSVWSIKSGEAGVSPASLRNEIMHEQHPRVRECLQKGWTYVWCTVQPASHDTRDRMRKEADAVAELLKVDPRLIEFRWPDHLEGETNLYPNLIAVHLPDVAAPLASVRSLKQWGPDLDMRDDWVNFGGRDDVVWRVTEHLLGKGAPNVLHIAGLSGIGKTRTVFEACRRESELNGVFYVERFDQVGLNLYHYLEEDGRHVQLVVDETHLHQVNVMRSRVEEFADRVRVVTIGPAYRQAGTNSGEIIVLPEPDTEAGVLEVVVRAAGGGLSDDVLRSIAAQSGHDLRLALLLVRASLRTPEFRGLPVSDFDGVWRRLMELFGDQVGDPNVFRERYEVLTAGIDVGLEEDVRGEIEALADWFQQPVDRLLSAAHTAAKCGLGINTRRFFEATPRALAARLFETRVWHRIRDRLDDFVNALVSQTRSDRLARRFLERCQDCTGGMREEVMARVGSFFLGALSGEAVTVLSSREASRLFETWAEFDPDRGLRWLRQAVEQATPEQLRALDGEAVAGGWRGRRQLVWLCQNLASFEEHFEACEAVLFRLALHETEPSIGNNSSAIWQSLFWPMLAGTSTPFSRRLPILLRRLSAATPGELPLVLKAALGCIEHRLVGLPIPPRVVGGRVVPPFWAPQTHGELRDLRRQAAGEMLDAIARLPDDRSPVGLRAVAEHLRVFVGLGLLDRLRAVFGREKLDEPLRRRLFAKLEEQIAFLRERQKEEEMAPSTGPLEEWLAEISPQDLETRVRDLTAQKYWSVWAAEERTAQYDRLAEELVGSPETFRGLEEWFAGPETQSAGPLAFRLGVRDEEGRLAPVVRDWMGADRCRAVTVGYLRGTAARENGLPAEWAGVLEALADGRPELVAIATTTADVSVRGVERLLGLLDRLSVPASRFLQPLAFGEWLRVLRARDRSRAAEALVRLAKDGDTVAAPVGLDLIQMWAYFDREAMDQELSPLALELASRPDSVATGHDLYNWQEVLRLLAPSYPRRVAELVVGRMTDPGGAVGTWDTRNVEVLTRVAAADPAAAMEAVGGALLDPGRRAFFGLAVFRGLFEKIGLPQVQAWVSDHGLEHLRWLARHFPSPYLDEGGRPVVPPLTEWLFREHEADQQAFSWFLMGRHSGTFFNEADVEPERIRREMQRFLGHELRRVRKWAEYEVGHAEELATHFRERDEEDGRR